MEDCVEGKVLISAAEPGNVNVWGVANGQERATLNASSRLQVIRGELLIANELRYEKKSFKRLLIQSEIALLR